MLRGRDRQRVAVDALLERARDGRGGALVLRGEPGSGKTSLLRAARLTAADFDHHPRRVLLCVDDAHDLDLAWLLDALSDLADQPVAVLIATEGTAHGLPCVELDPLDHATSVQVLRELLPGLSTGLADEVARVACGNPLALVELARSLTSAQLGGAEPPPDVLPPNSSLRARLRERLAALSPHARHALAMTLVDDEVDVDTLARTPGLDLAAVDEAAALMDPRPLVRATLRAELPVTARYSAHATLADTLSDGPRRTWHEAAGLPGPRDCHADVLRAAAVEARKRGDFAAAARDHGRAAALTTSPDLRAQRLLSAAADHWRCGLPHRARATLRAVVPLSARHEVRMPAALVESGIEVGTGVPAVAARRLSRVAEQLLAGNRALAVTALGFAGEAAAVAGDHVSHGRIARTAAGWRTPDEAAESALVLDHLIGTAASFAGRHDAALPALRSVVELADRLPDATSAIWGGHAAFVLGDVTTALRLTERGVAAARDSGLTTLVPWALTYRAMATLLADQLDLAREAAFEGAHAAVAAGQPNVMTDHLMFLALLAALLGDTDTALHRIGAAAEGVRDRGLGRSGTLGAWALTCVDLVRDRPADALGRMGNVTAGALHAGVRALAAPDIVEAAVRCGEPSTADSALRGYTRWVHSTGPPSRLAVSHRCLAMVSDGPAAEDHFTEAIRLHLVSGTTMELAKTELFYAGRLRRNRKPRQARELLHDSIGHFERHEADHWVNRARAELHAVGEPPQPGDGASALTPQQDKIARLVAEGATNREVAARLFLSQRTVEHHLRNIFTRLGVRSRVELARVLD
ncbi:helix-turn-helix transcriptional regulator [Actinophytocola oryzae]|uniref:Regulatory LuxR family protein n=1 Tax=Actinophytocola oryzae TaxID=502181 RepID=A0A4R7W1P3_9PSEU|nr:LuxR C-terminal-related transcriptional regulator [Actinophytocola oryzae]TDV56490.1 regulatory LuxR family protein [Actinophytocola oryzae]